MTKFETATLLSKNRFYKPLAILTAAATLVSCSESVGANPPLETTITTTSEAPETMTPSRTRETTTTPEPPPVSTTPETSVVSPPPSEVVNCMVERCIALTFDDGPSQYTERLLGYLKKHGAKATFFLVGTQVQKYPEVVRDIRDDGHQLANHSWNHDDLTMLGSTAAAEDIARTNRLISDISGVTPALMRPPYGATNSAVIDAVGMPEILWSVDPRDWAFDRRDSDIVADDVIDKSDRGDIVLMHDIHKTTVDAVPRILDTLISRGFRLVTVETLLGGDLSVGKYSRQQR